MYKTIVKSTVICGAKARETTKHLRKRLQENAWKWDTGESAAGLHCRIGLKMEK